MEERLPWQVHQIMDRGSADPIIARLWLQVMDLAAVLPQTQQAVAAEAAGKMALTVVALEERVCRFTDKEDVLSREVAAGTAFRPAGAAIQFSAPLGWMEDVEEALIKAVIALRDARRFLNNMLGVDLKSFRRGEVNALADRVGEEDPLVGLIHACNDWIKELYDNRGLIEHEALPIQPYRAVEGSTGNLEVRYASMPNGVLVRDYLTGALSNVFQFCEAISVLTIRFVAPSPIELREIPETKRDPAKPVRFTCGV